MKRTVTAEQYFTSPELARACVDLVAQHFELSEFERIIEPSAGAGAFVDLLPAHSRMALDLHPGHPEVARADFLTWRPPAVSGPVLTIGNPPFGQRGALAVAFLRHACAVSDVVAFVLPRSFNKYTFQNRVPLDFHLVASFPCEEFLRPDGSLAQVKAVFQVWEKRAQPRSPIRPPSSHPHFALRHAHVSRLTAEELQVLRRDYEFAVAQVGSSFRPRPAAVVDKGSQWFVRPLVPGVRERFELLDFTFLDGMNTAHKSLSKRDIVTAYTQVLNDQGAAADAPDAAVGDTRKPA